MQIQEFQLPVRMVMPVITMLADVIVRMMSSLHHGMGQQHEDPQHVQAAVKLGTASTVFNAQGMVEMEAESKGNGYSFHALLIFVSSHRY